MVADFRCGLVALVGRPNVGKSTLLNSMLGQKVSIVTPRPQTTRHTVTGILTEDRGQVVFIDTPGLHQDGKQAINRYMNRAAAGALADADVVVVIVEALKLTDEDEAVLERARSASAPVGLVINKVDRIKDKAKLLPFIKSLQGKADFAFIVPLSASQGENLPSFLDELYQRLPVAGPLYPEDQVTDRSMRFIAAELIREKLMMRLQQEVPYGITVEIERYDEAERRTEIDAIIWVGRDSHKGIVIGKGGGLLRDVGSAVRQELKSMLERPVHLQLWVKVRDGWADDEQALHRFGYE